MTQPLSFVEKVQYNVQLCWLVENNNFLESCPVIEDNYFLENVRTLNLTRHSSMCHWITLWFGLLVVVFVLYLRVPTQAMHPKISSKRPFLCGNLINIDYGLFNAPALSGWSGDVQFYPTWKPSQILRCVYKTANMNPKKLTLVIHLFLHIWIQYVCMYVLWTMICHIWSSDINPSKLWHIP